MWKERHSFGRAAAIIALSGKIVRENQALVPFSFSVLGGFIAFTFVWVLMFSRVFLRSSKVVEGGNLRLYSLLIQRFPGLFLHLLGGWVLIIF